MIKLTEVNLESWRCIPPPAQS